MYILRTSYNSGQFMKNYSEFIIHNTVKSAD